MPTVPNEIAIRRLCSHDDPGQFECGDEVLEDQLVRLYNRYEDGCNDSVYVAVDAVERVVGFVSHTDLTPSTEQSDAVYFYISHLAVARSSRMRFVGSRLMRRAIEVQKIQTANYGKRYAGLLAYPWSRRIESYLKFTGFQEFDADSRLWFRSLDYQGRPDRQRRPNTGK